MVDSYTGKNLKQSGKIGSLMNERAGYILDVSRYFPPGFVPFVATGNMVYYGKLDQFGFAREPLYDQVLTDLEGTDGILSTLDFVADQYAVMKRKFEELSNKRGNYGILTPARATIRGDDLYDEHIDALITAFIEDIFTRIPSKIVNFDRFCREFVRFIKSTRISIGLPVSKSLFYASSRAPTNISGLVIDFKTDGYHDDAKKQKEWLGDVNFKLFCNAAAEAGFLVDMNHPWRIIADVSHKKMHRGAEYRAGTAYTPGTPGNIFEKYSWNVCEVDFLILKNKLFKAYDEIVAKRPTVKAPAYCNNGKPKPRKVRREKLQLQDLLVPPIPGAPKRSPLSFSGETADQSPRSIMTAAGIDDSLIRYGLHSEKYNIIYWVKLYVEVRYNEIYAIKNFLTVKEKNAIVNKAVKRVKTGDIQGAFLYIGEQFKSYRYTDH